MGYTRYHCKECKNIDIAPYQIEHHPLCATGILLKKRAERLATEALGNDGFREIDYKMEPAWYWAESITGAARGGSTTATRANRVA